MRPPRLEEAEAASTTVELPDDPEIDVAAVEEEREAREAEERLTSEVEAWLEHEAWLDEQARQTSRPTRGPRTPRGSKSNASRSNPKRGWRTTSGSRTSDVASEVTAWAEHQEWLDAHRAEAGDPPRSRAQGDGAQGLEGPQGLAHRRAQTSRTRSMGGAPRVWMDGERVRVEAGAWAAHELWLDESKRKKAEALEARAQSR